jgi:hypothetical protein
VQLPVWQNLLDISPSQYCSDKSNNNNVITTSVVHFLPDGLDESSIDIVHVCDPPAPPPGSRRLTAGDVTYVNYTITFTSDAVSTEVDSITDELEAAVADGAFTAYLQNTASTEGSALVNADSTLVTFGVVEPVTDAGDDDDDVAKVTAPLFFAAPTLRFTFFAGGGLLTQLKLWLVTLELSLSVYSLPLSSNFSPSNGSLKPL